MVEVGVGVEVEFEVGVEVEVKLLENNKVLSENYHVLEMEGGINAKKKIYTIKKFYNSKCWLF